MITKKQIAKDILKMLDNGLNIRSGIYVDFEDFTCNMSDAQEKAFCNMDAKTALKFVPCEVCALGAITLALVDRKNTLKMKDLDKVARNHNNRFLTQHFSKQELLDIELFFECCDVVEAQERNYEKFSNFLKDGDWSWESPERRCKLIFKYIAKSGSFVPEEFIKWYEKEIS